MEQRESPNQLPDGFISFAADQICLLPHDISPIEGYKPKEKFPYCCGYHTNVINAGEQYFELFPECCDEHSKLKEKSWFDKDNYKGLGQTIVTKLSYTECHICERIETDDWYKDITEYFEYIIQSFGHPAVGLHIYVSNLKHYLKDKIFDGLHEKRERLLNYLEDLSKSCTPDTDFDMSALLITYQRWLKTFPFELGYFRNLKGKMAKQLPLIDGEISENRYTGLTKARLTTLPKLFEFLANLTRELLSSVNSVELYRKGLITNAEQTKLELINEHHKIQQLIILGKLSEQEQNYARIVALWLANEKDYYKDISPYLLKGDSETISAKKNGIEEVLAIHGFYELSKVKCLSEPQKFALKSVIEKNDVPYKIAMLQFLGFIDLLLQDHLKTKEALYKLLANTFVVPQRTIKGNLIVLNEYSNEDRKRYTSHLHKQKVEKDYKNLK